MQLDTITELLDIPNYKVTHLIQMTAAVSILSLIRLIHYHLSVPAAAVSMRAESTTNV